MNYFTDHKNDSYKIFLYLNIEAWQRKTAKLFIHLRHLIDSKTKLRKLTWYTLACYIIRYSTQNNLPWLTCIPQWPSLVWFGFGWVECCTMTTNDDQWHLRTMAWPYKVITLWLLWLAEEMGWHDESGRQDCLQPCSPAAQALQKLLETGPAQST